MVHKSEVVPAHYECSIWTVWNLKKNMPAKSIMMIHFGTNHDNVTNQKSKFPIVCMLHAIIDVSHVTNRIFSIIRETYKGHSFWNCTKYGNVYEIQGILQFSCIWIQADTWFMRYLGDIKGTNVNWQAIVLECVITFLVKTS